NRLAARLTQPESSARVFRLSDQLQARGVDEEILIANVRAGHPIDITDAIDLEASASTVTADDLSFALSQDTAKNVASSHNSANQTFAFIVATFLFAGLLTAVAGFAIARSISRPLGQLTFAADRIASDEKRDLPDTNRRDEIGDLSRALGPLACRRGRCDGRGSVQAARGSRGATRRDRARRFAAGDGQPAPAGPALPEPDRQRHQVLQGPAPRDRGERRATGRRVGFLRTRQRHRHRPEICRPDIPDLPAVAPS